MWVLLERLSGGEPAPMMWRSKCKNIMKDVEESKARRMEDATAAVDTSDCESYESGK